MINALLVRWAGGWAEVTDATSIASYGRREALLGLGAVQSLDEVTRIANGQLAIYGRPRTEISADMVPGTAELPYRHFAVGDTITVPEIDGTTALERVMALTVAEDENGVVTYVPELKDVLLQRDERWEQNLKKMADGTFRGQSAVATPTSAQRSGAVPAAGPGGAVVAGYEATYSAPGVLLPRTSPQIVTPLDCTLSEIVTTVRVPDAVVGFTVNVYRDDVSVFSEAVAANTEVTRWTSPTVPASTSTANTTAWYITYSGTSIDILDVVTILRYTT